MLAGTWARAKDVGRQRRRKGGSRKWSGLSRTHTPPSSMAPPSTGQPQLTEYHRGHYPYLFQVRAKPQV